MNFSVCVIGKNEAETLPRLAKSLEEFLRRDGEVIFMDTGSTDGTAEIARQSGFTVHEEGERFMLQIVPGLAADINSRFVVAGEKPIASGGERLFDYSCARNIAADLAENDMIAVIDCDEWYTVLDLDALQAVMAGGFAHIYHQYVFSRQANGQPSMKFFSERMYDRRAVRCVGVIHEVPVGEGKEIRLPESVVLVDHAQKPEARRDNYLVGLALDCYWNPSNDRNSHYFGRELLWRGRPKSAIRELHRHIRMGQGAQERGQSMVFSGDAYAALDDPEEAVSHYQQAFTIDGSRRAPLIRLAEHYWRASDLQKAACYAAAALVIPASGFYGDELEHYRSRPHEILYHALWWLGDKAGSREHWLAALAYDPENAKFQADAQFYQSENSGGAR